MVTLREAFSLLRIRDDDCVFFLEPGVHSVFSKQMLGRQVRDRLDMRAVKVLHIDLRRDYYDGEFFGYELEVINLPREHGWHPYS